MHKSTQTFFHVLMATTALATQAGLVHAQALPTGGEVAAGQAVIGQTGSTMTIDQSTQRAAINWQTFDIGKGAAVTFNQPNAQAQVL
ncbi:MAG: hypothetical protein LBV50_03225, partial [Novosphingobium sp.]|nr:hypothetical protein [Novosphingobium sp.]